MFGPSLLRVKIWGVSIISLLFSFKMATYDIHECEEVILHVLLPMEANNRVVDSQKDFYVVVVLSGVSAPAMLHGVIDLLGQGVKSPGYIQLHLCKESGGDGAKKC